MQQLRPAPRRHRAARRQPAGHDRQRRRRRRAAGATGQLTIAGRGGTKSRHETPQRGAPLTSPGFVTGASAPSSTCGSGRPAQPGAAGGDGEEPEDHRRDRQQRQRPGAASTSGRRSRTARARRTTASSAPHQGATSPEAAYRKNAAAIPAMPMNGHGDALARPGLGRTATVCRRSTSGRCPTPRCAPRPSQGTLRLLLGGVRAEPVDGRADVLARLHGVVLHAVPELAGVRSLMRRNLHSPA